MSTVRSLVNVAPGEAEIQNVPFPELPRDDYILVKGTAWAINPDDIYHLDLDGALSCAGCRIGSDFSGVVVEVGPGSNRGLKTGDRVGGVISGQNVLRKTDGAFAEYFAAKDILMIKIPKSMSDAEGATQGIALMTVAQSLYRDLQLPWPDNPAKEPFTLFVYGGSTAMGITSIQFAKLSGATVLATSSPSNFSYLKSLGADHVLDYHSSSLVDEIRAITGDSLQLALDCCPSEASAIICAKALSYRGGAKYTTLVPGVEECIKEFNPNVETHSVLAFSASGEEWFYEKRHDPAPEDYELAKKFTPLAEKLLAEGKVKAPRIEVNRGGKGLEGLLYGMNELRENRVSAQKLVYTLE